MVDRDNDGYDNDDDDNDEDNDDDGYVEKDNDLLPTCIITLSKITLKNKTNKNKPAIVIFRLYKHRYAHISPKGRDTLL